MDEKARNQIREDLDHTYLVEAGAGTGKTTLLVARILQIVRSGKASLPQVVAITFTEKAAQELKNRLKERLEAEIENQSDPFIQKVFNQALRDLEYSSISTIHGFCNSILREKAVEAQVDIGFTVVNESGANILYDQVWERWLLQKIRDKEDFLRDLLRLGISFEQMQKTAALLARHQDLSKEYFQVQEYPICFQEWQKSFQTILAELEALSENCKNREDRGYQRIQVLSQEWNFLKDLSEKDSIRRLLYGIEIKSEGNKKNWSPGEALTQVKEKLQTLREECEDIASKARHNLTQKFLAWIKEFLDYYQAEKEQNNMLTFEDLLICTRNMLQKNKDVRKELQQRYLYILVDEFQDTDPLQTEILFFLSEKDALADEWQEVILKEGKFFAVGDPKQAIYRFRRADIEIYESVKQQLGKERFLEIQKNFRSSCGILDWVNHIFSHLIQPPEEGMYQPSYSNLYAHRTNPPREKSVYYLSLPERKGISEEESLRMEEIVEEEAESIARMISVLIRDKWPVVQNDTVRDVEYGDMAILVRRFSYVETFEKALTRYKIPYQVIGSKSYYSRIEIKSLLVLLRSILEPYNAICVTGALRSPVFSVSDEEIFLYKDAHETLDYRQVQESQTHIGKIFSLLRELHGKMYETSIPLFLQEIFEKTGILLTFMSMNKGENRVANLLKILQLAYSFSQIGIQDFSKFVNSLKDFEEREQEESESFLESQLPQSVKIISIHRAKGLEFPVVFLGDLAGKKSQTSPLLLVKEKKRMEVKLTGKIELKTAGYDEQVLLEKKKTEAEEIRLLYVAATRAKDYLFLPTAARGHGYFAFLDPFLQIVPEDFYAFSAEDVVSYSRNLDFVPEISENQTHCKDWEEKRLQWMERQKRVWSKACPQTPSSPMKTQTALSQAVHSVLSFLNPHIEEDLFLPYEIHSLLEQEAQRTFLTPQEKEQAAKMLENAVHSSLQAKILRSKRFFRAVPFSAIVDGKYIQDTIDLYFQEKNKLYLVAYKTDIISSAETAQYASQYIPDLKIWAKALQESTGLKVEKGILYFLYPDVQHLVENILQTSTN